MDSNLNTGDKSLEIAGLDDETIALMREAIDRQDGTYAIDPVAHTMKRIVRFSRPPTRRAVPVQIPGRIQTSARSPRRRSIRSSRARARAPDDPDPDPLEVVPLSRFRREVRRWLEGAA
jgi:hypothetical protein